MPDPQPMAHPIAAHMTDVDPLHELLRQQAAKGNLLPRTKADIYRHIRDFVVLRNEAELLATGALEIMTLELGEIRSLAVVEQHQGQRLGLTIVTHLLDQARLLGLRRVMALTYVPEFFRRLGFGVVEKEVLPEKVWEVCIRCYKYNRCDETAMLLDLHPSHEQSKPVKPARLPA